MCTPCLCTPVQLVCPLVTCESSDARTLQSAQTSVTHVCAYPQVRVFKDRIEEEGYCAAAKFNARLQAYDELLAARAVLAATAEPSGTSPRGSFLQSGDIRSSFRRNSRSRSEKRTSGTESASVNRQTSDAEEGSLSPGAVRGMPLSKQMVVHRTDSPLGVPPTVDVGQTGVVASDGTSVSIAAVQVQLSDGEEATALKPRSR